MTRLFYQDSKKNGGWYLSICTGEENLNKQKKKYKQMVLVSLYFLTCMENDETSADLNLYACMHACNSYKEKVSLEV